MSLDAHIQESRCISFSLDNAFILIQFEYLRGENGDIWQFDIINKYLQNEKITHFSWKHKSISHVKYMSIL